MSKFKVGDRVKPAACTGGTNLIQHWDSYWAYNHGESDGTFYITGDLGGNFYSYSNKPDGDGPQVSSNYLELVRVESIEKDHMPTLEYSCIRVVPPTKPKREIVEGMITLHEGATIKVMKDGADDDVRLLIQECPFFTAKALREAAALFTTLAEVLEENSNA